MGWHLGIDPGRAGAAVALAPDGYAEVLWSWRTSASDDQIVLRVAQQVDGEVVQRKSRIPSPFVLRTTLAESLSRVVGTDLVTIGCEHVHIGKNAATGISQALWLGRFLGPLEHRFSPATMLRPAQWRRLAGFDPKVKGPAIKGEAIRVVTATVTGLEELIAALGRKGKQAHDYEAGGIAWAARAGSKS